MKISRRVIILSAVGVLVVAVIAVISLTVLANPNAKATPTPAFSRRSFATRTPTAILTATETPAPTNTYTPTATLTPTPTDTPQPTATSEQSFKLVALSSPVKLDKSGAPAFAKVLTSPGATCNLVFTSSSGKILILAGTGVATADVNGICSWNWTIPGGQPTGAATVTISVNMYGLSFPMILN
jgi:hypothetical protein